MTLGDRESLDSRSAVFDVALDAIVTIDCEGRIVEFNTAAEAMFGLSRLAARGQCLSDTIIPERFREAHRAGLRRYLETGVALVLGRRIEVTALRADGIEFPVELAITRVPGAMPPVFTGFLRDLTTQRRLEKRRAAVYRVATALADAPSFAAAAGALLGILAEAFDAPIAAAWETDGDALRCVETYQVASVPDQSFAEVSRGMRFASGVGLPGRVWTTPAVHWVEDILVDDNLPRGAVAARLDLRSAFAFPVRVGDEVLAILEFFLPSVTERDEDLVRLSESVGHQIAQFIRRSRAESERAQLLVEEQRARIEAEQANRAKDDFLAMVAHELRTPLNAVLGWAALLKSGALGDDKRDAAIAAIERGSRTQAQIIEDLLDATRIIHGTLAISFAPVDAAEIVRGAVDMMQPTAASRGVTLVADGVDRACMLFADKNRLQQVASNLLSNAVKFTSEGGTVRASVSMSGSRVRIVVRDNGIGIAKELLPHIFERFRQGPGSRPGSDGLGLGLAIARRLVELHGGEVQASSAGEGAGTTVTVTLPIDARQAAGNDAV